METEDSNDKITLQEQQKSNLWIKFKSLSLLAKIFIALLIYVLISFLTGVGSNSSSTADEFLRLQRAISSVNGEWQIKATALNDIINDISSSQLTDNVEIVTKVNEIKSEMSPIITKLTDTCRQIPLEKENLAGEEAAIEGAFEMLRVLCNSVPAQTLELYSIISTQISAEGTQSEIDYHVTKYREIQLQKLNSYIDGLTGILPYLTGTDKSQAESLLESLNYQLSRI